MKQPLERASGLMLSERRVSIAHLARRAGSGVEERLSELLGVQLPAGPRLEQTASLRILGISPGRWLALREPADGDFAADLAALLQPAAAVCDQSDAFTVLRLQGTSVRPALAKLVGIDLHERAFPVGLAAATVARHVAIILWREPDEGAPVFELAVPLSYTAMFREVLEDAASEFGLIHAA